MELIWGYILVIVGIVAAAASGVLSEEFKAWLPWVRRRIIERAVRNSPKELRERLAEEWPSHVEEFPGDIGKLIVAFGLLAASWNLSKYEVAKRVLDVALSTLVMIFISPLVFAISLLIRFTSVGPVMLRQRHRGRNGKEFVIYKFRIETGSIVQTFKFDDLLVLLNVIQGDMSIVGPPPLPVNLEEVARSVLNVKPGITGLSQLEVGKTQDHHELDAFYVINRSFLLDLKIMLKTAFRVLGGERK